MVTINPNDELGYTWKALNLAAVAGITGWLYQVLKDWKGNPPFPPFAEEFCEALFDQLPESSPSLGFPMPFRADIEAVIISDDSHLRSFQYWQLSKMSESAPGQKTHRDNNQHQKSTFPNRSLFMGPPSTNQYHSMLTQYRQVPTITAIYWPSIIIYQPVPLHTDQVPPSINHYRPLLIQYHQVPTIIAHTDPVTPSTNQYSPLLIKYHQVSVITCLYWPSSTPVVPQCHHLTSTAFY